MWEFVCLKVWCQNFALFCFFVRLLVFNAWVSAIKDDWFRGLNNLFYWHVTFGKIFLSFPLSVFKDVYCACLSWEYDLFCLDEAVVLSWFDWDICFSGCCAWVFFFSFIYQPVNPDIHSSTLPSIQTSVYVFANTRKSYSLFIHPSFTQSAIFVSNYFETVKLIHRSFSHRSSCSFLFQLPQSFACIMFYPVIDFFILNWRGIQPLHAALLDCQFFL